MSDRESNTGDASEVRCDTQESDPEEEIKCTRATGDSQREIPSLQELEGVLYSAPRSCRHGDEVWPHLYLGDMFMSHDKFGLWQLGITHVLNAAHGKLCCKGSDDFYGTTVKYFGVPANDLPTFDLSPFFYPATEFIHLALTSGGTCMLDNTRVTINYHTGGVTCPSSFFVRVFMFYELPGKVFVHCAVGVSRSAALVLAYLMLHHRLTLLSSIRCVQEKRWIFPNRGFLRQLIALDRQLRDKGLNEPK
ncbi:dual specificity protein phosphatase 13A family protein isoform X1 [Seriola aureovittata]|uniref:dual specificity protein phosphatase 13A family protein isoform X1 n=1 Tax=Seriola aureovittata TaxID=2871759 RepID=UPI0024BEBA98|nr:dual specificity protein phosphatase 13A family protein isoform X1 [Seriola aureovittata]